MMGGFKQKSINEDFQIGFHSHIVETIEKCCILMKRNCISSGRTVKNHEVNIQNRKRTLIARIDIRKMASLLDAIFLMCLLIRA